MGTEEKSSSLTSFPLNWTLSKSNPSIANVTQTSALLDNYPRDWSLSTISKSTSDEEETRTITNAFPIALSDQDVTTSHISSPATFQKNWILPSNASVNQHAPSHDYEALFSSTWSPNATGQDKATLVGLDRASVSAIVGRIPPHVIPRSSPFSSEEHFTRPPGAPAPAVTGNFRPRGYSVTYVSPAGSNEQPSGEPSSMPANFVVRRLAGSYNHMSPMSVPSSSSERGTVANNVQVAPASTTTSPALADWSTLEFSPGAWNGASYYFPRPVGTASSISPQSVREKESTSLVPYRPPRPAGFGPNNVSPPMSVQTYSEPKIEPTGQRKANVGFDSRGLIAGGEDV